MLRPGRCRWCRCTYEEPCPGSCGWANREQTLCTACVDVERAWRRLPTKKPNMVRAFFRGFMVGADDERAIDHPRGRQAVAHNPYSANGQTAPYWSAGFTAGRREAR